MRTHLEGTRRNIDSLTSLPECIVTTEVWEGGDDYVWKLSTPKKSQDILKKNNLLKSANGIKIKSLKKKPNVLLIRTCG